MKKTIAIGLRTCLLSLAFIMVLQFCSCGLLQLGAIIGEGSMNQSNNSSNQSEDQTGKSVGLNQTITVGDFEFSVTKVYDTTHVGDQFFGYSTENNYVVLQIKVKNTSRKEITLFGDMIQYTQGSYVYDPGTEGVVLGDHGYWVCEAIGPGLTKTYDVVYETASSHSSSDYLLVKSSNYYGSSGRIYMK